MVKCYPVLQIETAARAVAFLEVKTSQEAEEVEQDNRWDFSDRESLNSVCHLGCAGPTLPGPLMKSSRRKNDMLAGNLSTGFLEVGVDANLLEVGSQLEDLVKAAQTYGQLRCPTEFFHQTIAAKGLGFVL